MRKPISILLFALAALLASCDDGRVEENIVTTVEGRTVKMTGNISGIDKWADGYTVALAGFKDDDVYAVVLRNLSQNETGTYDVVLPGITDQVSSVELCILNRLHQRVATIRELTDADLLRLVDYQQLGETFVTTEDGFLGEKGFVTMHSIWKQQSFDKIYVCGPKPMMKAVAKLAAEKDVWCEVSLENLMACGLGACLCCVEDTVDGHVCVCKEGPVFNTRRLKW